MSGRIDIICCECGTPRQASASRFPSTGGERWYLCATCNRRTMHGSAIGVADYCEKENEREGGQALAEYGHLAGFMELAGFQIRDGRVEKGAHASAIQYYGDEGLDIWDVRRNGDEEWKGVNWICKDCRQGHACSERVEAVSHA